MSSSNAERAKAARNAYARKWRAKNPDKVKAAQKRYWDRVAERMVEDTSAEEQEKKGEKEK